MSERVKICKAVEELLHKHSRSVGRPRSTPKAVENAIMDNGVSEDLREVDLYRIEHNGSRKRFSAYISMLWPDQKLMYYFYDKMNSIKTI